MKTMKLIQLIAAETICLTSAVLLWDAHHDFLAAAAVVAAVIVSALAGDILEKKPVKSVK